MTYPHARAHFLFPGKQAALSFFIPFSGSLPELFQEGGDERRAQPHQGNEGEGPPEGESMGNVADDRRPQQEAQKADGGDGGQGYAWYHFFGFSGHAVAKGNDGGGSEAHQQEAQRGGPQHGEQDGDQQPGGNENAAGAQHAHGAEAHHHAVRRKASQGHGAHERHVAHLHQSGTGLHHAFKVHAAPVKHGSLAHHASEGDQSDHQDIGIHAPEHASALGGGAACIPRQEGGGKDGQNDHAHQENGDEVHFRGYLPVHHQRPQQGAEESRQAPQAMEPGHDAALVQPLHSHALRVDGDIRQISGHSEEKQPRRQFPEGGRHAQIHKHGGIKDGSRYQYPPAAATAHQIAGQRHGGHLPHRNGKEHGAKVGVIQSQRILDIRNTARPTGEYQALEKIEGADRQAVDSLRRFGKRQIHAGFPGHADAIPIPFPWQEKSSFIQ